MCQCLSLTYQWTGSPTIETIELNQTGEFNGYPFYLFTINGITLFMWHDAFDNWYVSEALGDITSLYVQWKSTTDLCPEASMPVWDTANFDTFTTAECATSCDCIVVNYTLDREEQTAVELNTLGTYNGRNYYEWTDGLNTFSLWWDGSISWVITTDGVGGVANIASSAYDTQCPFEKWTFTKPFVALEIIECGACYYEEDRTRRKYTSIKFPDLFIEQNRGLKDCCCKYFVLASLTETESWKNDISSAWVKLSNVLDSVTFTLKKNGVVANFIPVVNEFINEESAFYTTIEWRDVLATDGVGCYTLEITFEISGVTGSFIWGEYDLKPYTIQNALKTARVSALFNAYHETEQIDFTGSNVPSTHRFFGFIGKRQPNMEIDNIIYSNREMKRVIRENLNDYEIITDPSDECIIKPLIDLYLLSENELFISDYNAHNHSYRYLDLPVIVAESPSIEYKDFSRKAVLTCKVSDKFKQNRTYYNG